MIENAKKESFNNEFQFCKSLIQCTLVVEHRSNFLISLRMTFAFVPLGAYAAILYLVLSKKSTTTW